MRNDCKLYLRRSRTRRLILMSVIHTRVLSSFDGSTELPRTVCDFVLRAKSSVRLE